MLFKQNREKKINLNVRREAREACAHDILQRERIPAERRTREKLIINE